MDAKTFRTRFNKELIDFVEKKTIETKELLMDAQSSFCLDYAATLVGVGGKRVRPYVAYLMYVSAGGQDEAVMFRVGIALELLHAASLVQDDVFDAGTRRYGLPTIQIFLKEKNLTASSANDAVAILCGNILISWAFQAFEEANIEPAHQLATRQIFIAMFNNVNAGQLLDVLMTTRISVAAEDVEKRNSLKTSLYTFIRPMQIGVSLSGMKQKAYLNFCTDFGASLGSAFQLVDDLGDFMIQPENLDTDILSDLRTRQHTVFTNYIVEHGTEHQRKELQRYFGTTLSRKDQASVRELFVESGAVAFSLERITLNTHRAVAILEQAPDFYGYADEWRAFIEYLETTMLSPAYAK